MTTKKFKQKIAGIHHSKKFDTQRSKKHKNKGENIYENTSA
jgi:hypothetical protein